MLGFDVRGAAVRYPVPLTALSAVVAIGVVGLGLSLVTLVALSRVIAVVAATAAFWFTRSPRPASPGWRPG